MTVKRNSVDEWVTDYMTHERRRNVAYGAGALVVIALFTLAILYYFGNMAAVAW